ncbi:MULTISPECIES: GFA family protein [Silvimonas]|uniref:GFA family protein n=1 Tax=Silvimonas TaxID=300264 RepID=UPI0024B3936F|nr:MULTISPECIES: GFA family protein [Silvimonas]MDR3427589.1 GFA family protein [Silvimonas sp.]
MQKSYHGSCHCGAVQFRCELDLAAGTTRCNCSVCSKGRFWLGFVPAAQFELLAGHELLADYQFGAQQIHHRFCLRCGIKPFGTRYKPELGSDIYAINIACLDDVPAQELAAAPVRYVNGRHDDWGATPAETSHL